MPVPLALRSLTDLLFPRTCAGCDERLALTEHLVCPKCASGLPFFPERDFSGNARVGLWHDYTSLERVVVLCRYRRQSVVAHLVHRLKYHRQHELGGWMGWLAARELEPAGAFAGVDLLVPLPLTRRRQWHRGFNQAEAIAAGLSRSLGIPLATDVLVRVRERESQTHFDYHDRLANAVGVFRMNPDADVAGRHVMLVDDVMTTGTTMRSALDAFSAVPGIRLSAFAWASTYIRRDAYWRPVGTEREKSEPL